MLIISQILHEFFHEEKKNLTGFLLSRLLHEFFHEEQKAFEIAKEGAKNDKYSKCLLGFYMAHGIGTNKNYVEGMKTIIESGADDFIEHFATDIGNYYSKSGDKKEGFKWYENAFKKNITEATVNNYGLCFLIGTGTNKNTHKAKEIFSIGVRKSFPSSLYHMAFIALDENDLDTAMQYFKHAADLGHICARDNYNNLMKRYLKLPQK